MKNPEAVCIRYGSYMIRPAGTDSDHPEAVFVKARTEREAFQKAGIPRPTLTLPKRVTPEWLRAQAEEFRADGSSDLYRLAAEYEERADYLEHAQHRV